MSRHNYVSEPEFDSLMGVDTTTPLGAVQPGFLVNALNADLGLGSGVSKRNGFTTQLSSAWGSRNIVAGLEYKNSSGVSKQILYGQDGTDGRFGFITGGAVTSILTGLSATARPSLVQFGDLMLFFNGVDSPRLYDGSTTRTLGITPPSNAPTLSSQTTGGSLTLLGAYFFVYTYYNSATKAESSPSPISAQIILSGSNCEIVLGVTAGNATFADTIRVYRTGANGSVLFLDGTAAISATSYTSTVADAGLVTALELDNSQLSLFSSTPNYPAIINSRVFVVTNTNEIRFSKIGQSGPMPESYQAKAVVTAIGKNGSADPIVGLGSIGVLPIVVKTKSIGRLDSVGLQDTTNPIDPQAFVYTEISNTIGGVSHFGGTQVLNEYVWVNRDNVYATDGNTIRPVGDKISATILTLGFTANQITKISAINYKRKKQVHFACFTSGAAGTPTFILVGDYKLNDQYNRPVYRWTFYSQGSNTSTWPSIQPGCYFPITSTSDGNEYIWFGNSVGNGQVYQMDTGTNDASSAIYYKLTSRPYSCKTPLQKKLFKTAEIFARGNGNTYNLTVSAIYDLSGQEESAQLLSLASNGSLWDNVTWDNFTWADSSVTPKRYDAHRKAFFQQLVFTQSDTDSPVDQLGWGTSGSLFGAF